MITLIDEKYMPGEGQNAGSSFHVPVLLRETVSALQPAAGKIFLDGTVGGGGHSLAFLEAGASVIACDQDPEALTEASRRLAAFSGRVRFVESNFADLTDRLQSFGVTEFDGILLDLGISSHQLDTRSRGFSFLGDGPLDMRMGPHLVKVRTSVPIQTTQDLVRAVESIIPKRGPKNPATKVFQALRIAVNGELSVLERALHELRDTVKPGGRMAVITFHSLEDRIVKRYFREVSQEWVDRPEWPAPRRNPAHAFRLITSRPIEPSEEEVRQNSRARSAKLRVIEGISNES